MYIAIYAYILHMHYSRNKKGLSRGESLGEINHLQTENKQKNHLQTEKITSKSSISEL